MAAHHDQTAAHHPTFCPHAVPGAPYALASVASAASAASDWLQLLCPELQTNYSDGEVIMRQGDSGDDMFLISQVGLKEAMRVQVGQAMAQFLQSCAL